MATSAVPGGGRRRVGTTWFALEITYVVLIAAIAAFAMTSEARRPLVLVAALVALPIGPAAIVGLYVLTGLFNWVAAGFSTYSFSQTTGGCNASGHCWTRTTGTPVGAQGFLFCTCIVLLFVGAALTNVLILRSVVRGRADRSPSPRSTIEPDQR